MTWKLAHFEKIYNNSIDVIIKTNQNYYCSAKNWKFDLISENKFQIDDL